MSLINIESNLKYNLLYQDFEINSLIASGSFGDVFKATNKKIPNKFFAIKVITLRPSNTKDEEQEILHEISILEKISDLLIKPKCFPVFYGYAKEISKIKHSIYYIIFDYLPTSLRGLINSTKEKNLLVDFQLIKTYYESLLNGLAYLQSMNLCHRDLKPDNILLDESQNCTIVDFGAAKENASKNNQKNNQPTEVDMTIIGTQSYMSPEILEALLNEDDSVVVNPYKSDVFSFGLIILELATQSQIKHKNNINTLQQQIQKHLHFFESVYKQNLQKNEDLIELQTLQENLRLSLEIDPKNRPDFIDLFKKKTNFFSEKEKLRFHIFIEENDVQNLSYLFNFLREELVSKDKFLLKSQKSFGNEAQLLSLDAQNEDKIQLFCSLSQTNTFDENIKYIKPLADEKFLELIKRENYLINDFENYFKDQSIKGFDLTESLRLQICEPKALKPLQNLFSVSVFDSAWSNFVQGAEKMLSNVKNLVTTENFDEKFIGKIAQILQESSNISHLNLSDNPLAFKASTNIMVLWEAIKKSKILLNLNLANNNLNSSTENVNYLCEALKSNQNILSLNLMNNNLGRKLDHIKEISCFLKANNSLLVLDLSNNRLIDSKDNLKVLSEALKANKTIQKLSLSGNLLHKDARAFKNLADMIKINRSIIFLDLSKNKLAKNQNIIKYLAESLASNTKLLELNLANNKFGEFPKTFKLLLENLQISNNNIALTYIDFTSNDLGWDAENLKFLLDFMTENKKISSLILENNEIGYNVENVKFLAGIIKNNQSLSLLNLKKNKMGEVEYLNLVLKTLLENNNLKILDLRANNMRKIPFIKDIIGEIQQKKSEIKIYY